MRRTRSADSSSADPALDRWKAFADDAIRAAGPAAPAHGAGWAPDRAAPLDPVLASILVAAGSAIARARWLDPAVVAELFGRPAAATPGPLPDRPPARVEHLGALFEHVVGARSPHGIAVRKRSGTFFTAPRLSEATTELALRPWLGTPDRGPDPEALVRVAVCDPAAGGGAFLVAALRLLSKALTTAARAHRWLDRRDHAGPAMPAWLRRWLARGGPDHDATRPTARLRSWIARRCLFGVDLDPNAVALSRLCLWLEVRDPSLRPAHLARQIRHGNALVGAWPQNPASYPRRALERDAGDRSHRGVHFAAGERTRVLRAWRDGNRRALLAGSTDADLDPDAWCALWFWPIDRLNAAPRPGRNGAADTETSRTVEQLRERIGFFHWTREFARVFARRGGFDVVIGNPPWDTRKPDSREFFSIHDPGYRRYSKPEARRAQRALFAADPSIERSWLDHIADHRALTHWFKNVGTPFRHQGTTEPNSYKLFLELGHALLRDGGRLAMIVPSSLYNDLGAADLRRLFLEHNDWRLLLGFENRTRLFPGIDGRFKFCPIVVHKGGRTTGLRAAFMLSDAPEASSVTTQHRCVRLDASTIRRLSPRSSSILEIQSRADLDVIERLHATGHRLGDQNADGYCVRFRRELDMTLDSARFADRSDLEAAGFVPDLYSRWLRIDRRPVLRVASPDAGWIPLRDRGWIRAENVRAIALPVYEGRMVGQFDFSEKGWVEGRGRRAKWHAIGDDRKPVEPQFLIDARECDRLDLGARRVGVMAVGSATNQRSMVATALLHDPCGNAVPTLRCRDGLDGVLLAVLNSFVFDYALRARLVGNNLNRFLLAETPLPAPDRLAGLRAIDRHVAALNHNHERFAARWAAAANGSVADSAADAATSWRAQWAVTPHERLRRRCVLDALVAGAFGLHYDDLAWILRDCHHPRERLADRTFTQTLPQKGFWRVDQDQDPELRHPVLTLAAFAELSELVARHGGGADGWHRGARAFCELDGGLGWSLPEELELGSLGLDGAPTGAHPVRSRLGPCLTSRQRAESVAGSWSECRQHAARCGILSRNPA